MNASDRLNTCKSRGRVAIPETGARVRNAYAIYLYQGNSPEKFGLMPHSSLDQHWFNDKDLSDTDEHAYD
jgi:hypothetical protein